MPVSESEKHQGNVLGCRFSNKAEHVPIKKRRFLFRSPSPPPEIPAPNNEENTSPSKTEADPVSPKAELGKMSVEETDGRRNCPKKVNEKLECSKGFSGISILAAAACSSSLGREFGYAEDGLGVEEPSVHEGHVEVSTSSEAQSFSKGLVREDFVNMSDISIGGASSCVTTALVGELPAISTTDCASGKAKDVEKSIKEPYSGDGGPTVSLDISRDDRLHWDLNIVMDAWEQPFGYQDSRFFDCISQGSGEPRESVGQVSQQNINNQVIDDCNNKSHPISMCHMPISLECKNVSSLVDNSDSVQVLPSSCVDEKPPFLNTKRCADSETIGHAVTKKGADNETIVSVGAAVTRNRHVSAVDSQVRLTVLPTLDNGSKDTPKSTLSDKSFGDEAHCLKDDSDTQICVASQVNNDASMVKAVNEIADPQRSRSMHKFTVASDIKAKGVDFSMDGSEQAGTDFQVTIKEDMMTSAEHLEQKFISDASCDPCSTLGTEAAGELQVDYDSQYEDGELRESSGHLWEEYDATDGEAERINYGFDNRSYNVSAAGHRVSGSGQVRKTKYRDADNADNISSVSGVGDEQCAEPDKPITDDKDHGNDNSLRGLATDELLESNKIYSATGRDDCDGEDRIYRHGTGSTYSETNMRAGSRLYRRGLVSRIERPVGHYMSFREDRAENRWERGSSYVKSSERVRYSMQSQPRARQVNSWNGSSDGRRGIKRSYSPSYRPPVKPDEDDTAAKEDRGTINPISYSSHPLTNDESIADGDVARNFKPIHKLDGDLGSDRLMSRGRFLRYGPRMDRSAGRGRYHVHSPDDTFQSSLKYRRPLSRRDRSVSPNERRGYPFVHQSYARSSSRSRTRSPDPRISPRGRSRPANCGGIYLRHRSRSPGFRSEARLMRMRSPPHHQPGFGADHMTGFRSFQRDHSTPPSRWITGRKDKMAHFGYKQRPVLDRSPGRFHLQGDRADLVDSARNPKPDVYYRPNTGRFSQMHVTGRELRSEENYENRRRRFGPIHPARRGYEDGIAKRLHHDDEDDDFVSTDRDLAELHGRGVRGVDNRNEDMPRGFMYERDGKFSSNSNLRSGEMYRSINPGRFNEMGGAGRGHRYLDHCGDRRRRYGAVHLPRRSELEGMERRLSHDVGDSLLVTCNDDATDCRGRNARDIDGHVGDLPRRQREEQQLDLSGQEQKIGETSNSTDVQVPGENEAAKGSSPS